MVDVSHSPKIDSAELLKDAARATAASSTLEDLTRPFLDLLHTITKLDSTYLTEINMPANRQDILFSLNNGMLDIPEGLGVEWDDSLCKRAMQTGQHYTNDVPTTFPDSKAARQLGLQTYISVPVHDENDDVVGTLCGASSQPINISEDVQAVMEMFARLISDQWRRDRERAAISQRADNAEMQLRQRALFLAEAEHKLKTPLTILKGWSSMLADGWPNFADSERTIALRTMEDAADRATLQVNELLDESRNHILAMELHLERINLTDTIRAVAREMSGVSSKHHVLFEHADDDIFARVDERGIWQVLWHLGENAIKYSPAGGEIAFHLRCDDGEAEFCLTDEGLGIPTDIDLFEPFTRSADDAFADINGTGLGLHIVRNLVLAMDGTVTAERRSGKGSVFTVRLPLA
jgi:signal transduction histidine kinase